MSADAPIRPPRNLAGLLVAAWAAVSGTGLLPPLFLPSPVAVARVGWEMVRDGSLWVNIGASLGRVLIGIVVSVPLAVGAATGVVMMVMLSIGSIVYLRVSGFGQDEKSA